MNEHAKEWVVALRSGQYTQTVGALNRPKSYDDIPAGRCCLGVACDLYMKAGNELDTGIEYEVETFDVNGKPERAEGPMVLYDGDSGHLPLIVANWLGLSSQTGSYSVGVENGVELTDSLAGLNDGGSSFADIAATIESEPEGLLE